MKELWELGQESTSPLDNWVSDDATKQRYKRSGALLGFLLALILSGSSKSLCELSTGSDRCGFGSASEAIIFSLFTSVMFVALGWWMGDQWSKEHPAFRRFSIGFFALIGTFIFGFPIFLYQVQPEWKTRFWDDGWENWAFFALILIYSVGHRIIKRNFEKRQ